MKLLSYLLFGGLCIALLYGTSFLFGHEEPTLSHEATDPDLFLGNAKVYAMEHAYDRSLMHLDEGINSIRAIEQDLDPDSKRAIDDAVENLKMVYSEIAGDSLSYQDMNEAFVKVLNALTYAEIKVSEHYYESEDLEKAQVALKYGRLHMKNALKYVDEEMRNYEVKLYHEIDSLIESNQLSNEEIIAHLENVLIELENNEE